MRISDWSSDVCSSDLPAMPRQAAEVAVREIPAPLSTVDLPAVPARPVTAPDLRAEQAPSVAVRDIPAPTAAPPPAAAGSTASSQAAAQEAGAATQPSSEERRAGQECVRTCRPRWPPHP